MIVTEAIAILKSKKCKHEDKTTAYSSLVSNLKNDAWEKELKTQQTELLQLLYRDILDTDENVARNAFHVLNVCHGQVDSFQKSDSEMGLKSLIQCGQKTSSVDVIKYIFDFLSVQRFHSDVLTTEISVLLGFIEKMNSKVKAQSISIAEKNVQVFVRFEKQIGKSLRPSSPRWSRLIFPGLVNVSHDVREDALTLLEKFKEDLCNAHDLSRLIIKAINDGLARSLKSLIYTHEAYVLRAWPLIVQVAGKELHKGSTINSLLEIIEIGFKGSHVGRHNAFIAWRSLIDNFALDRVLLVDSKRIKLLLMVLRIDNAKVEHVAKEKLYTWWHLCLRIDTKLTVNFEMIVHPLLQFCVGSGNLHCATDLGPSPRLALKTATNTTVGGQSSSNAKCNLPVFLAVQKLGCQVIARLISKVAKSEDPGKITWTLDALSDEVMGNPAIFVKHSPIILTALERLLTNVGNGIEENLMLHIWISLGNHLKAAMDSSVKTECRDIFSTFLTILHTIAQNRVLNPQTILKMVQVCCSFPQKVLASTAYNITGGQTIRACPAQLLNEVLLSSHVMENLGTHDVLIKLFSTLVNAGASNLQGALLFIQTVTEMLHLQALSLTFPELLWKLWNTLAQTLKDTVNTTNEVNQGDALEYNFGCMYTVLLLPIKFQLASKISQTLCKALLKSWKELYHSFARLSALVATAEANSCLEEISAKIIEMWNPDHQDSMSLEFLSNICCTMLECADFSGIAVSQTPGGGLTLSPSKWVRRRQRPLGNLHSFIHLTASLQTEINIVLSKVDDSGNAKKQDTTGTVIMAAQRLVEVYTKLFVHITTSNVISNCVAILASPLARFYQPSKKTSFVKLFVLSFITKLEKLWQEIALCITSRYNGPYDSEFLSHLSPLLEVTFVHSRRSIRNQTQTLWNTTFGRMSSIEYPSSLKCVLQEMWMKKTIIVPGLISADDTATVAETPFSEMSMGESQVPAQILPHLASPKRQKGSLLNRDISPAGKVSPKPGTSPAKIISPKEARSLFSGARKRIELDLLPKEAFVVIDSPTSKKKRLLTDHQKEVLKQKCVLPAMYNSIDSSQDVSMMSQFGTETQQSISSTDVIVINSSESQERANELQTGTKHPKEHRGNEDHGTSQLHMPASSRRRSVRIHELNNSVDEIMCSEFKAKDESTTLNDLDQKAQSETFSGNTDEKSRNVSPENDEKSITEKQITESLVNSLASLSSVTHIDTSNGCNEANDNLVSVCDKNNLDSPFLMFRTKQQTRSKLILSQSPIGTKSPRRISLRKVRSEDDIQLPQIKEETLSPKQIKMPRRVPLKKINEQECELDSESFSNKKSLEEKLQGSSLSSISKLDCCTALSEQLDTSKTVLPTDSTRFVKKPEVVESDSSIDVSCTLVEDTQSPFKVKQQNKEIDNSIAETPLKGENSNSPPVRAASARKLFVDSDTAGISQTQRTDSEQVVRSTLEKDKTSEEPLLLENSEVPSSQGFEIANDLGIQISSEQNTLATSHTDSGKECKQVDHCVSDLHGAALPESESLFPNTQISNSSMDMMMPTISSPFGHLQDSLKSTGESRTTSTGSSELSNKLSSSSDSDFICLKPTLAEEVLTSTPNKRKRGTPKKLLEVKGKRHNKFRKPNHSSLNLNSSANCKFESVSEGNSTLKGLEGNTPLFTSNSSQDSASLLPNAQVDPQESAVFTKIKIERGLHEIGEVTPDIKSPRSNPQRRHSSVKRMGRLPPKRTSENSEVIKSLALKKIKVEPIDCVKSEVVAKIGKQKGKSRSKGLKSKFKTVSPCEKKKIVQSPTDRLCKNRHLLKTRNKITFPQPSNKKESSPNKRSLPPDRNDLSDDEDSLTVSSYLKKYKKDVSDGIGKVNHSKMDTEDTSLQVTNAPITKTEDSQTSYASDNESDFSLHCSEADILIIDAAVSTALQRILLESTKGKTDKNENVTADFKEKDIMTSCGSFDPQSVEVNPEISYDHTEPEQQIVSQNSRSEAQEPAQADKTKLGDSACSDTAENVVNVAAPITSDFTAVPIQQEEISTGSSKCNGGHSLVTMEITQPDTVLEQCLSSENVLVETEQTHPDVVSTQHNLNEYCSSTHNPNVEDNEVCSKEHVTETGLQKDNLGSPERNVQVYDWSPTKSPSCSILKRCTETPPSGKSRRVSFAEPVVSGESPVRNYYKEFCSTSPMISPQASSPGQKPSLFNRSQGSASKYRRRLESSRKQTEPVRSLLVRKIVSPQTQLSYRPTQESQLDNSGPVFPDLVDCTNPLDDILPQLTSSLWYRGLCQLMKGRNINTIGDLSSLTEVQIDQLPIRHPKVESVKSTLNSYMAQHGLAKSASNSENMQDDCKSPRSRGSTIEQEITPASIDDDGIQIHPNADKDLTNLSPIRDSESPKPNTVLLELEACSSSNIADEDGVVGDSAPQDERPSQILSSLKEIVKQSSDLKLKKVSMVELFDIHQTLNLLFANVVEEMKSRHSSG